MGTIHSLFCIVSLLLLAFFVNSYSADFNVVYFDPDGNLRRVIEIQSEGKKYFNQIDPSINFIVIASRKTF